MLSVIKSERLFRNAVRTPHTFSCIHCSAACGFSPRLLSFSLFSRKGCFMPLIDAPLTIENLKCCLYQGQFLFILKQIVQSVPYYNYSNVGCGNAACRLERWFKPISLFVVLPHQKVLNPKGWAGVQGIWLRGRQAYLALYRGQRSHYQNTAIDYFSRCYQLIHLFCTLYHANSERSTTNMRKSEIHHGF